MFVILLASMCKDENSATKHHPYATETFMLSGEKMAGVQKYETHFAIVC